MITPMPSSSPFPPGWWSFDLGSARPCDGTYQLYPIQTLPPVDEELFEGDLDWLLQEAGAAGLQETAEFEEGGPVAHIRALEEAEKKAEARVAQLASALGRHQITLPAAFVRFMSDPGMQRVVPSCTACEWDLSEAPVASRVVPGAFTIRFLRDQQDCLFWYLHIGPDHSEILVSPIPFDDPRLDVTRDQVLGATWVCAPHFEHFVYRFWIENELWETLQERDPHFSPAQRAYLAHYEQLR
jgi:hypothetical protein